jgi:hypothetical protein
MKQIIDKTIVLFEKKETPEERETTYSELLKVCINTQTRE